MTSADTLLPAYAPPFGETSAFTQQPARATNFGVTVDHGVLFNAAIVTGFGLAAGVALFLIGLKLLDLLITLAVRACQRLWLAAMRAFA